MTALPAGFAVAIARVVPTALLLPPLGWWGMPVWLRAAVGIVLAMAAAPAAGSCVGGQLDVQTLLGQLWIGLVMAITVSLPFWAFHIAGAFADATAGWSAEHDRFAEAAFVLGAAAVAAAHGHTWIVAGVLSSVAAVPSGLPSGAEVPLAAGEMLGAGVLIALPLLAVCGVAHLIMALAERLFIVPGGIPVRPAAVVVGMAAMVPMLLVAASQEVQAVLGYLAAGR